MNANDLKKIISSKIKIGDSRAVAEGWLSEQGFKFSFDKYAERYQATVLGDRDCSSNHVISLYIYIDKKDRISSIEAIDSYTMP